MGSSRGHISKKGTKGNNELDGLLEVNVQLSYKNFRIVEGNLKDRIIDKAIDVVGEKVKDKLKDSQLQIENQKKLNGTNNDHLRKI